LFYVNAQSRANGTNLKMTRSNASALPWQEITNAPLDCDLELAVIDDTGAHVLVFPCRRRLYEWVKADTLEQVNVRPTHWRRWEVRNSDLVK
jgi:hypothetical protein